MSEKNTDLAALVQKAEALQQQVDQAVDQAARRTRTTGIVSIIAIVVLGIYFVIAVQQVGKFNAKIAADNVHKQIENQLPELTKSMAENLKANAPNYIRKVEGVVLTAPQEISRELRLRLMSEARARSKEIEDQIFESVKAELDRFHAVNEEAGGEPLTLAQTQKAVDDLAVYYAKRSKETLQKFADDYSQKAEVFVDYLHRLGGASDLDAREQLHRNMIQSFLAMIEKTEFGQIDFEDVQLTD